MIATATHYISMFTTNCVEPTIDWSKKHKIAVSTVGIGILLGAICYKSPEALDITKKNIKFLTVVIPIAYTLVAPVIGVGFIMAGGAPNLSNGERSHLVQMFDAYCKSIVKIWLAWFRFVGISA